jgi:hypothetical protein
VAALKREAKLQTGFGEASPSESMSHDLGPFFQSEMEMKQRTISAIGTDPADTARWKMSGLRPTAAS